MASFRDIWNLIVTGDTSDVERKLKGVGTTTDETGRTVDTTFRGRMSASLGSFAQKIPGVSGLMDKFGVSSQQAGALMGTAVAGGAAVATAAVGKFVAESVAEFQSQAQDILHFKDVTGLMADEASRFVAVADDYEVSADELSTAIGKLDKTAGTTPQNLSKLGIQIGKNAQGGYDAQQTFLNVVDAFNATDDASQKAAIGSAAFGKNWQSVVKLLDQGSAQLKTSFAEVKDFQIFNEEDLKKSEDYRLAMDELDDAVKGLERSVGEALVPALAKAAHEFTNMIEEGQKIGKFVGAPLRAVGADAADFFKVLNNPGGYAIDKFKDLGDAIGDLFGGGDDGKKLAKGFDNVANSSDKTTESILRDAAAVANHKYAMDQAAESAKVYLESNQGYRDALDQQREAAEKATKALQDYRTATQDLRNDQLGLEGAIYSALDAVDAYTAKTTDATSTAREQAQANIAVQQSFADVAAKAIEAAAQQAAVHGATLTANGAIAAQVSALQGLYTQLAPDSPLRVELDRYILALYNIPGQIVTNVDLTGNGLDVLGRAIGGTRREGSGANGQAIAQSLRDYERGLQ